MKKYTFKLNKSGLWNVFRNKELICGGYLTEDDAIIGLANYIQNGANLNLTNT